MQRTTKSYQCHPWRWILPVFVFLCCDKSLAINIDVAFADVTSDSKIVLVNAKDLTEINVSVQVGDDYTGTVQVRVEEPSSGGPRIKLWPDPLKTGQELPKSWEVPITNGVLQPVEGTKPVKFWVEGIKESATTDDVVIKATLSNGDVDEVKLTLLPVEVRDISNNKVITDIAWIKGHKTDGSGEEPEMPKLEARIPGLPDTVQVLWKLESRYPRRNGRDDLDVPYAGGDDSGVFTTGDQPWKIWEDIDFSTDPIFGGNETLKFKLIGSNGVLGEGVVEFEIRGENPDDARCKAHIIANQGSIWYAWAIAKHESGDSKGEYNQFANGLDNGGAGAHGAKGEPFYAPSEGDGWGLFQRDSASGAPVTTKETWSWDGNMRGFLNDEYPEQIRIANNYVDSVKRNNPATFVEPQFTIKGQAISGRHVLALTWYNGPQGRSNSRLMHFNGSTWSLDLPNAPEKGQPYVHEIMDTYNGQ